MPPRRKQSQSLWPSSRPAEEPNGVWKDVSSHSRDDKDRTPNAFHMRVGPRLRLSVHRHIHYPPDVWLSTCEPFWSTDQLESKDATAAKTEALSRLRVALSEAVAALP